MDFSLMKVTKQATKQPQGGAVITQSSSCVHQHKEDTCEQYIYHLYFFKNNFTVFYCTSCFPKLNIQWWRYHDYISANEQHDPTTSTILEMIPK